MMHNNVMYSRYNNTVVCIIIVARLLHDSYYSYYLRNIHTQMQAAAHHLKPMPEWEVEEVCGWLEEIGLGEYRPQFRENEILGEHLLELTKDELAELGIKKIGHKKRFFTKVKELAPST